MDLTNERKVKYTLFDMEKLTKDEYDRLRNYGLEKIKDDGDALVNYAANHLLVEFIQKKERDINELISKLPADKSKKYQKQMAKIREEKTCK